MFVLFISKNNYGKNFVLSEKMIYYEMNKNYLRYFKFKWLIFGGKSLRESGIIMIFFYIITFIFDNFCIKVLVCFDYKTGVETLNT